MNKKLVVLALGLAAVAGLASLRTERTAPPILVAHTPSSSVDAPVRSVRPAHTVRGPLPEPVEPMEPMGPERSEESLLASSEAGEGPGEQALAHYEALLKSEPRDPAWSSGAEATIRAHLGTLTGVDDYTVSCAGTLCRIELALLPEAAADPTATVKDAVPWPANLFASIGGVAGEPTAVLFVAREGHPLPQG